MRILPDHPNLDHLRRQAKDLLAGLRETAPETSLAAAQAGLAEQYGFRTWADLKAEVDRRRSTERTAPAQLAEQIAERFALGRVTGPMTAIAPGNFGHRWMLPTDRGRWSVHSLDEWWPIVDVETEVKLQEAAAAAGVVLPAAVRSTTGGLVETVDDRQWRVTTWLHDGPPLLAPASSTITHEVGRVLAAIHGLGMPVDRISPWHAARLSPVPWADLARAAYAQGAGWASLLDDALPRLTDLETLGEGSSPVEPVLTHNALGPAMARVGRDGRLVVFDWEHAGGQPPAWELSDVLMHWTIGPDGRVNEPGARALVAGYRDVAGAVPELSLASFQGAGISVANYVDGQIGSALDSRGADRDVAERSVRHVLTHLPTTAALSQLLAAVD